MSKKANNGLWNYLDSVGILEKGTDAEIKAAKKAYWKEYITKYKRNQRTHTPEFNVGFSSEKGEFSRIQQASKAHKMTITGFIKTAALSYLDYTFIPPNPGQIARLEQVLSECLNQIQTITKTKEKYFWDRGQKYEAIEKRIEKIENSINEIFRRPISLEAEIKKAIQANPSCRDHFLKIISSPNDSQNQIAQKTNLPAVA
jgi:hypothetical protein